MTIPSTSVVTRIKFHFFTPVTLARIMSTLTKCHLISLESLHDPIELIDNAPLIVGRQKRFKIKEVQCSKEQVEITAHFREKFATVKLLGSNPASIDSKVLDGSSRLTEGQILCLVNGRLPYQVKFLSSTNVCETKRKGAEIGGFSSKKVKMDDGGNEDDDSVAEKLRRMRETFSRVPTETEKSVEHSDSTQKNICQKSTVCGWRKHDNLLTYKSEGVMDSANIAAFDMDGTIITTKSGRVFPTSPDDWQILYAEIPKKLKSLHANGYKIVFLTNQLGITKGKMTEAEFRRKAEAIISHLGCPVHLQAGIAYGIYRKPALGTWTHLLENENAGIDVDMSKSFYCGDAAGRPENKGKKRKKDHSCSDRLFALNVGLRFFTPEEYFMGEKPGEYVLPEFNPRALCDRLPTVDFSTYLSQEKEVIVNVGFPGSGKSYFSKTYLVPHGYIRACRDDLGSWQKCAALCQSSLKSGKSVVIDNTNPDKESRSRFISVAKANSVPCRCFYFPATLQHAKHNEVFRQLTDKNHNKIPDMIMNSFKSKFQMPKVEEGFKEIVTVPFVPKFKSKMEENLYRLYLLEK